MTNKDLQTNSPKGVFSKGDPHPVHKEFFFHRYRKYKKDYKESWVSQALLKEKRKNESRYKANMCPIKKAESKKKDRLKHKDYYRQYDKKYREENKERISKQRKIYREKNKEKLKKISREQYLKNKDRYKAYSTAKKRNQRSFYKNLSKKEKNKIIQIYKQRDELNLCAKSCGSKSCFEVDHIYPVKNKFLCGLHIYNNLRIIEKDENRSKFNSIL